MTTPMSPTLSPESTSVFDTRPQRFIDVGHSALPYWSVGRGPDVLFVHGWPLSGSTFRHIIPHLAASFTCHVFDLPGAGESRFDANSRVDVMSHVDTVLQVARDLELTQYGIVAHDSGAAIARYAAARDPGVCGLVIAGTEVPGYHTPFIRDLKRLNRLPGAHHLMRLAFSIPSFARSKKGFAGCFTDPAYIDGDFTARFITPLVRSAAKMRAAMRLVETLEPHHIDDLEAIHGQLNIPVQLIWGSADPFFPLKHARAMMPQFQDAQMHVIDRGRLFIHEEYPEVFAKVSETALLRGFSAAKRPESPAASVA